MGDNMDLELEEMKKLLELKEAYGWSDTEPLFKKRVKIIQNKYLALTLGQQVKTEHGDIKAPRFDRWETVSTTKAKSFDDAYVTLVKVAKGDWKPDKFSRGGVITMNKEAKCDWRRRVTTDGKNFARVVHTSKGYVIQRGILAQGTEGDEEDDQQAAEDDHQDGNSASDDDNFEQALPKALPRKAVEEKKRGKSEKACPVPPPVEEEAPAKRQRRATRRGA
jgi:hypothetical protein